MQSSRCRSGDAPANAVTRRSHTRIFVRAADEKKTARPRSATSECHSVMPVPRRRGMSRLGLAHFTIPPRRSLVRTAPSRAGQRLGANMTRIGEAGFSRRLLGRRGAGIAVLAAASILVSQAALADEGGVSFWLPGFFGSLAASPLQPGWSLTSIYYHTSV